MSGADIAAPVFELSPRVRYVAVRRADDLHLQERDGLSDALWLSRIVTNKLLVNPTLVMLAKQRDDIDCGELDLVLVGSGTSDGWSFLLAMLMLPWRR